MYGGQPSLESKPKDYGINGFLPKGTLQLFRFLLSFPFDRLNSLLSFFRFFFWKKMRSEAERATQQEAEKGLKQNVKLKKQHDYEHHRKTDKRRRNQNP